MKTAPAIVNRSEVKLTAFPATLPAAVPPGAARATAPGQRPVAAEAWRAGGPPAPPHTDQTEPATAGRRSAVAAVRAPRQRPAPVWPAWDPLWRPWASAG